MKVGLSPEITLLLMACSTNLSTEKKTQLTHFLSQHPLNWERLYALAGRHRLKPFLYQTFLQIPTIPESFLAALQQDCRISSTDNLLKLHQYHVVSAILTENNIDHMPLKGIFLAEHCYPDSGLRISGDIDVLVRKEDVFKTVHLLQTKEYHLNQQQRLHWQQGEQVILTDLFEVSLFKPFFNDSYFDIDLHWQILGFNRHYALFDLAYVRSEPTFSTEREVVLLVIHHGVNNVWQQIYYVNDLYFFLNSRGINWDRLMQELRLYGLEHVFLAGLYWCYQVWNIQLPEFIHELVLSPRIYSLAEAYSKNWEADNSSEFSTLILKQLSFFIKAQTKFNKQLKICSTFISSRVFRYSLFRVGKRLIYLPKELGFITILIRTIQSLFRFLPTHR
ncbi:nucleotidyltransferase family protein [Spirosoma flavum]|uniref:Nucleotidyltransferase family protein n=1 Tax=Spirosoma flavum TaxID=2048557 RepID=A0ABW6ACU9_9BACT